MERSRVLELFDRHIKVGYGTVTADEVGFIQDLIIQHQPKNFIEIGMASGMSTGLIASFMDTHGGERLVSLDHDDTFFGDNSKPNGFLFPEIYTGEKIQSELVKFKVSLDMPEIEGQFDMAFVDANHSHPWPAIDMMALYPRMTGPRIMIHHDLKLFMKYKGRTGIGPKFLFDQFPESHRQLSTANDGNIFAVDLTIGQEQFESILSNLFSIPWTGVTPLTQPLIEKTQAILKQSYSKALHDHFMDCLAVFNKPPAGGGANAAARDIQMIKQKIMRLEAQSALLVRISQQTAHQIDNVHELVRLGSVRRVLRKLQGKSGK